MTLSGSSVHESIESTIKEVESQSKSLASKIYGYENEISSLGEERENIYTTLSMHYLPDLESQSVQSTLREVQSEVNRIFKEKQNKRTELEEAMKSSKSARQELETILNETTKKLEAKAAERDK